MARKREVPGTGRVVAGLVFDPDRWSISIASSMAIATNTLSPMSAGRHTSGTTRGFSGDRGFGVNRMTGRTGPLQFWTGAAAAIKPIQTPKSRRLGAGAMPSGQPGLPSAGQDASGFGTLAWLGYGQAQRTGMGA